MKLYTSILVIILFLLGLTSLNSQETWSKRFGDINYTNDSLAVNWEDSYYISYNDSGLVIIYGWVDTSWYYWRTRFMEISLVGSENYIKDYGNNNEAWYGGYYDGGFKCNDGGFVLTGTVVPFNENNGTFPYLTKFNQYGDTLWMKKYYDASKFYSATNVIQCSDGGYAMVGLTSVDSLNQNRQIFVLRMDSIGNEIWMAEYGDPINSSENGFSIAETEEGGFIIGGYKTPEFEAHSNHYLMAIDSVGTLSWHHMIGNYSLQDGQINVTGLQDGNFLCVSGKAMYLELSTHYYRQCYIRKINKNGSVQWSSFFGDISEESYLVASVENPDSSVVVYGKYRTLSPTNQLNSEVAILAKFSQDGDSLWMREYSYVVETMPSSVVWHGAGDVTNLPDGGYAAVGRILVLDWPGYPTDSPGQDLWVFKTDSMGCLVAGCDTIVGITEYNEEMQQTWFTYGPNPVSDQLNIFLAEIGISEIADLRFELRNLEGKLIREFYAKNNGGITYIMDLENVIPGMYILSLYNSKKRLQSAKIVVR